MTGKHLLLDAGPFQRIVREAVEGTDSEWPEECVALQIWGGNGREGALVTKLLSRDRISFDLADRIVCKLGRDWQSDQELREVYESFDLGPTDLIWPTSEKTAEEGRELIIKTYRALGSIAKTSRHLKIGVVSTTQVLRDAKEINDLPVIICKNGHDTAAEGRYRDGGCRRCAIERKRRSRDKMKAARAVA